MDRVETGEPTEEIQPRHPGDTPAEDPSSDGRGGLAADAERSERSLRSLELGLVLLVGFGPSVATSLYEAVTGSAGRPPSADSASLVRAISRILSSLPPLCVLVYVLARRGLRLRHIGLTARWSDLWWGLGLLCLQWLPGWIHALASPHGFAAWHLSALSLDRLEPVMLVGLLLSAAKEELIVRAYMMSEVSELTGSAFLTVASSVCFQGLYHLYQGPAVIPDAIAFLIFSLFYWKTRRATSCVLGHFLWNLWIYLRA